MLTIYALLCLPDKIKIVLIGDLRVGKTTLRKRYMGEGFRSTYLATIGADFSSKTINNKQIIIYDLAGDGVSTLFRKEYYHGAQGIIIVYDITNRKSFENLPLWFQEIQNSLYSKLRIIILGNKDDLSLKIPDPVHEFEGYEFAVKMQDELNCSVTFLSTSALSGFNVDVAFTKLLAEIEYN